jgi:hypothetical protein
MGRKARLPKTIPNKSTLSTDSSSGLRERSSIDLVVDLVVDLVTVVSGSAVSVD